MAVQQYVLIGDGNGAFTFVVHYLTPIGNNAVGVPWATAVVNAGLNKTVMLTGTGPGQLPTADAAAITAGTMIEIVGGFNTAGFAALTGVQQQAQLNTMATAMIADSKARLQSALNFFGFTQGVAS